MEDLDLREEMILWAVWKLRDNAYGVTIRKTISQRTRRLYPYGTLYGTLAKLTRKGLLKKSVGESSPVRGGRSKNYYTVTPLGVRALKAALELKKSLWDSESEVLLSRGR